METQYLIINRLLQLEAFIFISRYLDISGISALIVYMLILIGTYIHIFLYLKRISP